MAKIVYGVLNSFGNSSTQMRSPSLEEIGERMGIPGRSVSVHVISLEKLGHIQVERWGVKGKKNEYVLLSNK